MFPVQIKCVSKYVEDNPWSHCLAGILSSDVKESQLFYDL